MFAKRAVQELGRRCRHGELASVEGSEGGQERGYRTRVLGTGARCVGHGADKLTDDVTYDRQLLPGLVTPRRYRSDRCA